MDGEEEARQLQAARQGDLAAFNWLVLRYQTRVYNLCYRMLSDADVAADATQETFLSAYKAIGRFKGHHFHTWLFKIATNACLDILRSRKRRPVQSLHPQTVNADEDAFEPLAVADTNPFVDPEARVLKTEVVEAIQRGLDDLPEDQRIALILVDVQGLSYEEAAAITGANLGTMKSRINRARTRMRDFLRRHGFVPSTGELSVPGERSIE